ncbi:MAG: ATP synthase F1 subunit delta [Candidatus Melainabacteria bacterium]|jgi:F-type H+-transporting ATPase subunit delta|nr:ATP synthase F1 subunit delta [Candidatus Melainabacteria bacterium]
MQNQKNKLIAMKYAEALAEIRQGETVIEDLELVKSVFEASTELLEVFASPQFQTQGKKQVLIAVFEGKVQKEVLSTLMILLERRRIELAPDLVECYKEIYYKRENIEFAKVSSTNKLETKELNEIKTQLETSFNSKVEISNELDESLIAGIKIEIANKVIDSSLKTKLKNLKSLLLN